MMDAKWFNQTREMSWSCTKLNCSVREAPRHINGRLQIHLVGYAGHVRPLKFLVWLGVGERGDSGLGGVEHIAGCYARAVTCEGFHGWTLDWTLVSGAAKHSRAPLLSTTERVIFAPAGTSTSA
jgi:hypothetical protein